MRKYDFIFIMGSVRFSNLELTKLIELRRKGFSIDEISKSLNRSKATIAKRVVGIEVSPEYIKTWSAKRGGSALRAKHRKDCAYEKISAQIGILDKRDLLLIAACLY